MHHRRLRAEHSSNVIQLPGTAADDESEKRDAAPSKPAQRLAERFGVNQA